MKSAQGATSASAGWTGAAPPVPSGPAGAPAPVGRARHTARKPLESGHPQAAPRGGPGPVPTLRGRDRPRFPRPDRPPERPEPAGPGTRTTGQVPRTGHPGGPDRSPERPDRSALSNAAMSTRGFVQTRPHGPGRSGASLGLVISFITGGPGGNGAPARHGVLHRAPVRAAHRTAPHLGRQANTSPLHRDNSPQRPDRAYRRGGTGRPVPGTDAWPQTASIYVTQWRATGARRSCRASWTKPRPSCLSEQPG